MEFHKWSGTETSLNPSQPISKIKCRNTRTPRINMHIYIHIIYTCIYMITYVYCKCLYIYICIIVVILYDCLTPSKTSYETKLGKPKKHSLPPSPTALDLRLSWSLLSLPPSEWRHLAAHLLDSLRGTPRGPRSHVTRNGSLICWERLNHVAVCGWETFLKELLVKEFMI